MFSMSIIINSKKGLRACSFSGDWAQSKHKAHLAFARLGLFSLFPDSSKLGSDIKKENCRDYEHARFPGIGLNPSIKPTLHLQGSDFFVYSLTQASLVRS